MSDDAALFGAAIGRALRQKRQARGLTRAQIEKHSGLGRSTVARIESGERAADSVQLAKFVLAINALQDDDLPPLLVSAVVALAEAEVMGDAGVEVVTTESTASVELDTSRRGAGRRTPAAGAGSDRP